MGITDLLTNQSTLTEKQVESLRTYLRVVSGELKLKEAAASRAERPVTVGSYYRTVQQARNKVKSSMRTIIIGLWLGLVNADDLRRLLELVGKSSVQLPDEDSMRFVGVLEAILSRMVL